MCARTCAVSCVSALGLRLLRFSKSNTSSLVCVQSTEESRCGPRVVELAYGMGPYGITARKAPTLLSAWTMDMLNSWVSHITPRQNAVLRKVCRQKIPSLTHACPVRRFKLVESSRDPLPGRLTVFVSMSTPPAERPHHDACSYVVSRYPIHLSRNAALESRTILALAAKIIRLAHVRISFSAKSSVRGCASMNREGSWGSGRSVSPSCMAMSGD
jgi:hypothetical protein